MWLAGFLGGEILGGEWDGSVSRGDLIVAFDFVFWVGLCSYFPGSIYLGCQERGIDVIAAVFETSREFGQANAVLDGCCVGLEGGLT